MIENFTPTQIVVIIVCASIIIVCLVFFYCAFQEIKRIAKKNERKQKFIERFNVEESEHLGIGA